MKPNTANSKVKEVPACTNICRTRLNVKKSTCCPNVVKITLHTVGCSEVFGLL